MTNLKQRVTAKAAELLALKKMLEIEEGEKLKKKLEWAVRRYFKIPRRYSLKGGKLYGSMYVLVTAIKERCVVVNSFIPNSNVIGGGPEWHKGMTIFDSGFKYFKPQNEVSKEVVEAAIKDGLERVDGWLDNKMG